MSSTMAQSASERITAEVTSWDGVEAGPGRIVEHPVFPGRHGPAARRIEDDADVDDVIALMRIGYEDTKARGAR